MTAGEAHSMPSWKTWVNARQECRSTDIQIRTETTNPAIADGRQQMAHCAMTEIVDFAKKRRQRTKKASRVYRDENFWELRMEIHRLLKTKEYESIAQAHDRAMANLGFVDPTS